jgi:hypothetical protein
VDGNTLNVDRWSAMEIGIKAVFNGQYPYNIPGSYGKRIFQSAGSYCFWDAFLPAFRKCRLSAVFSFLLFAYLIFKIFRITGRDWLY